MSEQEPTQKQKDMELAMEILTEEFSYNHIRYPKKFSWKAFKKFDMVKQQLLCERYNIILTDHETKRERNIRILKKFNATNISKVANQISIAANEISESLHEMTDSINGDLNPKRKRK